MFKTHIKTKGIKGLVDIPNKFFEAAKKDAVKAVQKQIKDVKSELIDSELTDFTKRNVANGYKIHAVVESHSVKSTEELIPVEVVEIPVESIDFEAPPEGY